MSPGHWGVGLCFRTWGCRNLYVGPCMAMAVNLMSACNRFSFNFWILSPKPRPDSRYGMSKKIKKVDVISLVLQGSTIFFQYSWVGAAKFTIWNVKGYITFLRFCKVQLFFFRIHEWEQPDSRFGMSKIRCHFFVFARFNIFLSKFMCGSVRN